MSLSRWEIEAQMIAYFILHNKGIIIWVGILQCILCLNIYSSIIKSKHELISVTMDNQTLFEIIGYLASIIIAISLLMKSLIRLRIINGIGALTYLRIIPPRRCIRDSTPSFDGFMWSVLPCFRKAWPRNIKLSRIWVIAVFCSARFNPLSLRKFSISF